MCQSKADGGRRCPFHLSQAVSAAMLTHTATVTGLTGREVAEVQAFLVAEGTQVAAPAREEVDAFLEQQAFRVRHEASLTEKRRESILNRLQAGIGSITPDGATFHAWKNLVAESWERVRRKAAAAFVAGALTFSLGACGTPATTASEPDRTGTVAVQVADDPDYDTTFDADYQGVVKPEALARYGPGRAQAGTDFTIQVVKDAAYDEELLGSVRPEGREDLMAFTRYMTPSAAKDFTASVDQYLSVSPAKDGDAVAKVFAFAFAQPFPVREQSPAHASYAAATEGPIVTNPEIRKVTTGVDSDERLTVTVDATADLRVTVNGDPHIMRLDRETTYWLVETDSGWKIDGWQTAWETPDGFVPAESK